MGGGMTANGVVLYWFRCPSGHLGTIDQEQKEGKVSIICDQCSFHGYISDGQYIGPVGGLV